MLLPKPIPPEHPKPYRYKQFSVLTQSAGLQIAYQAGRLTSLLTRLLLTVAVVWLASSLPLKAADLKADTLRAWEGYTRFDKGIARKVVASSATQSHSLEQNERERARQGELIVRPYQTRGALEVPNGLIHDWVGYEFLPHRTMASVVEALRDYESYPEIFAPAALATTGIERSDRTDRFQMTVRQKVLTVDAALQGLYRSEHIQPDEAHWTSITTSERIQEFLNYQKPDQKSYEPDHGSGFIWRSQSIVGLEEADGGVYVQLEARILSRGIPRSVSWIVSPVVTKVSRTAMQATLRQIAVAAEKQDALTGSKMAASFSATDH